MMWLNTKKLILAMMLCHGMAYAQNTVTPAANAPQNTTQTQTEAAKQQRLQKRRDAFAARLAQMTPEQRERAQMNMLRRIDSQERREKAIAAMAYFKSLPIEEQQRLRAKFQNERKARQQARLAKRQQTRVLLQSLSPSQRLVLKQKLQALDGKGKVALRDQLLTMQPADRERLLGK